MGCVGLEIYVGHALEKMKFDHVVGDSDGGFVLVVRWVGWVVDFGKATVFDDLLTLDDPGLQVWIDFLLMREQDSTKN